MGPEPGLQAPDLCHHESLRLEVPHIWINVLLLLSITILKGLIIYEQGPHIFVLH